jgi:ABC-2 type transport system permease protein
VTGGNFASPLFSAIYLGNAFYMYVGGVMTGMAYAVIDDRERYRMLKYVYVAPVNYRMYLIGRAAARFAIASVSVVLTLAGGVLFLGLEIDPMTVRWPLFVAAFTVGLFMLALMGLWLGGIVLQVAHQSWSVGEAVAGALFLFSGAVFPLDVLPAWLQPIGYALPVTYWLELLRRSLVTSRGFQTFEGMSDLQLFGVLVLMTTVLAVIALVTFARCEHSAREKGLIDRTTNY